MGSMKFLVGLAVGGIAAASFYDAEFRASAKRVIEAAGRELQKQIDTFNTPIETKGEHDEHGHE